MEQNCLNFNNITMKKVEKKNQDRYFVNLSTRNKHDDKIFMQVNYGAKHGGSNEYNDFITKTKIITKKILLKIEGKINKYLESVKHLDAEIQIDGIYEILDKKV